MAQILIFTGTSRSSQANSPGYGPGNSILRPLGAYQIAAILRNNGYTVQVVDYYWHLIRKHPKQFAEIIKKYVGSDTLWIGWSNTFFE